MKVYAYCRVSTVDQNEAGQLEALKKAYPKARVHVEKASGTSRTGRPVFEEIMRHIGEGDVLAVWKLDRLARDMGDLCQIVKELEQVGASLVIVDQAIDTSTASGKAFLQMLGVFAEFETNLRKERQAAGIAEAKKKGVYAYEKRAPKKAPTTHKITVLLGQGMKAPEIAEKVGCSVATVYNVKSKIKKAREADEQASLIE